MLLDKLFENLALNVQPFATCQLADDWRLNLPNRDWVNLHYVMEGEGGLALDSGQVLPLPVNALAVVPPGLIHAIQCGEGSNVAGLEGQGDPAAPLCELFAGPLDQLQLTVACGRVQVDYAGSIGLFDNLKEALVLEFDESSPVRGIFTSLIEEYKQSGPASAAMMTALMNQCLIEVLRRVSEQTEGCLPWLSAVEDPRLSGVMDNMLSQPEQAHTLESLAETAHMSRSTFIRHFEHSFQRTPMDYLRDVRLRKAAQLLKRNALSVDGIASKVGFASRSHFSRAFQAQFGCSPSDFRTQN